MRRILAAIQEMALEMNSQDNARCELIREAYPYMDAFIDSRHQDNGSTRLAEALTVGNFPLYFNRVLSRMVYDRYEFQRGTWRDYTRREVLPDYTTADRFRFGEPERPEERDEKEEAYATYFTEARVQLAVNDYAKQIDFSRRIFINDDLGAFNNIGNKMGDSAAMFEDFFVSAGYDNALTQAALVALGANYAGTGRLTTANLAIGWNAFTQRTDARGNPLAIRPVYLVIPPILELTARQILESTQIAELATNGVNVLQGALQIKVDPYIGFAVPNVPWYLFADPVSVPGVSVARWAGRPNGPELFALAPDKIPMTRAMGLGTPNLMNGSFLTGDIEIQVETTIGGRTDDLAGLVWVTDSNGVYYSSGTTP